MTAYDVSGEAEEWRASLDRFCAAHTVEMDDITVYLDAQVTPDGYRVSMSVRSDGPAALYVDEYDGFVNDLAFHSFYEEMVRELEDQAADAAIEAENIFGRW